MVGQWNLLKKLNKCVFSQMSNQANSMGNIAWKRYETKGKLCNRLQNAEQLERCKITPSNIFSHQKMYLCTLSMISLGHTVLLEGGADPTLHHHGQL